MVEENVSHDFATSRGGQVSQRSYLFLQGVCSPFFRHLAESLSQAGHRIHKINFNAGDTLYWGFRSASHYRSSVEELESFYTKQYKAQHITDIVLFGDCRPIHSPAVKQAQRLGLRTHVFEEGYFRPHWVTLEREGVNAHSLLPRNPDWYMEVGGALAKTPKECHTFQTPLHIRAFHDVLYHMAGFWNPLAYPGYRNHSTIIAPVEYAGYIKRLSMLRLRGAKDTEVINAVIHSGKPYYVLPLQLNTDAQIRKHSQFRDMIHFMDHTLASFSQHAPSNSQIVIKNHPLDMGLVNYAKHIRSLCTKYDLDGRVHFIESGDLNILVQHSQGVITVNSTVGSVSLSLGCPTISLSDPIYNLPGLTFQGTLDDFWQHAAKPSLELYARFRNTVIAATQINGGFYCKNGIALAASNATQVLTNEFSPLEQLLQQFPHPRPITPPHASPNKALKGKRGERTIPAGQGIIVPR